MSFLGGIAENVYWPIVARALMGIGGGLMWPSVLGIVFEVLPKVSSPPGNVQGHMAVFP